MATTSTTTTIRRAYVRRVLNMPCFENIYFSKTMYLFQSANANLCIQPDACIHGTIWQSAARNCLENGGHFQKTLSR